MASFSIHLAIGKRYYEKTNNINNEQEFYKGIIAPDLVEEKKISHYTGEMKDNSLIESLSKKVILIEFLKHEKIDTDYQKGVFLHLITDYLFFNTFFEKSYINKISYSLFSDNLYYSYNLTNEYIDNKYQINYYDFYNTIKINIEKKHKKNISNSTKQHILPIDKLDKFIEYVSSIDLEKYKEKILKYNENVLP